MITEGSTGFFGFGSKPAIIKVRKLEVSSEEAEIEKIVDSVKIESFKEEKKAPKQNSRPSHRAEKKDEPAVEVHEAAKERQPKPVKERTFKEKPVREPKEKVQKEKPVKQSRENRGNFWIRRKSKKSKERSACISQRSIFFHGTGRGSDHFKIQYKGRLSGG